jgi:hypothetical protein
LLGNQKSFPEIGVFLLISTDNQHFYFLKEGEKYVLPYEKISGGSSWENTVSSLKEKWGLSKFSHRLVGLGADRGGALEGLVFTVFHIKAQPIHSSFSALELKNLENTLSISFLAIDIIKKYSRCPDSITFD